MSLRERRERSEAAIRARTSVAHKGRLRATVTIRVDGRFSLGRAHSKECHFTTDLLFGSESERDLLRKVRDAVESTFYADAHIAQRGAVEQSLAEGERQRAFEHEKWMAENESARTKPKSKRKR